MKALATAPRACRTLGTSSTALSRGHVLPTLRHWNCGRRNAVRGCAASLSCNASVSTAQDTTTMLEKEKEQEQGSARWHEFAASSSGEWDGVTATFSSSGKPTPLPDYYVPQAFRDWGVTLYDWQSNCSTRCNGEGLSYTQRRMMPTVGCEADAVAFTSQEQQLFTGAAEPCSTVAADGSYSHGPADLSAPDLNTAAVEHCLALQPGERVRVVHNLKRAGPDSSWQVASIDVHRERFDAPYNGRGELTGCGGGMEPFAEKPALGAASLAGAWSASEGVEYRFPSQSGAARSEVDTSGSSWSIEGVEGLVFLPLGVWASAVLSAYDASIQVGVLVDDSTMRSAGRQYREGRLSSSWLQTLAKA